MQFPVQDQGLTSSPLDHNPRAELLEQALSSQMAHYRSDDELEAASIKWNAARIVRLSSGNFALLTHYRAGALDLIKVGTLEEIAGFIPTAEQCIDNTPRREEPTKKSYSNLLADIGL